MVVDYFLPGEMAVSDNPEEIHICSVPTLRWSPTRLGTQSSLTSFSFSNTCCATHFLQPQRLVHQLNWISASQLGAAVNPRRRVLEGFESGNARKSSGQPTIILCARRLVTWVSQAQIREPSDSWSPHTTVRYVFGSLGSSEWTTVTGSWQIRPIWVIWVEFYDITPLLHSFLIKQPVPCPL